MTHSTRLASLAILLVLGFQLSVSYAKLKAPANKLTPVAQAAKDAVKKLPKGWSCRAAGEAKLCCAEGDASVPETKEPATGVCCWGNCKCKKAADCGDCNASCDSNTGTCS